MNASYIGTCVTVFAALSALACGSTYETTEPLQNEPVVVECTSCTERNSVVADECGSAARTGDLEAAAAVAFALEHSVHELIACGAMSQQIPIALVETTVELIADAGGGSSLPGGFEFVEGGIYHAEGNGAAMDVRLFFDKGQGYELVPENLFEIDSYLVGAELDASASIDFDPSDPFATSIDVEEPRIVYDEPGPWALLLGFEPTPPNPVRVTDLDDISLRFDELRAIVNVHYEEERDGVRIVYDVESPMVGLGDLVDGGRLAFEIQSIEGRSADKSLALVIDDGGWQIDFIDGNRLDGDVSFTILGGAVPITGTLVYQASAYADVGMRCPRSL